MIDSGSTRNPTSTSKPADGDPVEEVVDVDAVVLVLAEEPDEDARRWRRTRRRTPTVASQPARGLAELRAEDEQQEEAGQRAARG